MNVTIVGAGLMGSGVAQVFLVSGHQVVLHDQSGTALRNAQAGIKEICVMLDVEVDFSRLTLDADLQHATRQADVVIEAVVEDLEVKRAIFQEIAKVAKPNAILASNTSAIPISEIAAGLSNPGQIVGTHFWNPPWAVDLVEVVEGEQTHPDVVERTIRLLSDLCLQPVHVRRDVPGCIGNRLQHALKREAIALIENGICDAETVDTVVKSGFGLRLATLGPLEQSDLVGLDLTLRIHETLIPDLDTTPGPAPLLRKRVAEGNTGMSTGKGFRDWTPESAAQVKLRLNESLVMLGKARIAKLQCQPIKETGNTDK